MNTEKALATKAAQAERFAAQTIKIDKDWKLVRPDALNWELRYKGKFFGYFGTLIAAFQALSGKMLGEAAKNSLTDLIERQKAINTTIEKSLLMKLA